MVVCLRTEAIGSGSYSDITDRGLPKAMCFWKVSSRLQQGLKTVVPLSKNSAQLRLNRFRNANPPAVQRLLTVLHEAPHPMGARLHLREFFKQ